MKIVSIYKDISLKKKNSIDVFIHSFIHSALRLNMKMSLFG